MRQSTGALCGALWWEGGERRWGGAVLLLYLGQLGVRGAIEGDNGVYTCILPRQETEGSSHAESHAPNLYLSKRVLLVISSLE